MKDNNKKSNDVNYSFQSPYTGKKFDPAKVLGEIQQEMKARYGSLTSDNRHITDLSAEIDYYMANLEMLLNGLHYLKSETALGDHLDDDKMIAIDTTFFKLKEVIEIREREHVFFRNMAFHGEENPSKKS